MSSRNQKLEQQVKNSCFYFLHSLFFTVRRKENCFIYNIGIFNVEKKRKNRNQKKNICRDAK